VRKVVVFYRCADGQAQMSIDGRQMDGGQGLAAAPWACLPAAAAWLPSHLTPCTALPTELVPAHHPAYHLS